MRTLWIFLATWVAGSAVMANDYEEPSWELIAQLESVEIRRYEAQVRATTSLRNSRETSAGFRRLAGFIFGGNDRDESIAMTTPVEETLGSAQPVMAFMMPSGYTLDELPAPNDSRVSFVEMPGRTVAAIRFSGWATRGSIARQQEKLEKVLARHGIEPRGEFALNQYNPPWTPPFKRRNEIVVEVAPGQV